MADEAERNRNPHVQAEERLLAHDARVAEAEPSRLHLVQPFKDVSVTHTIRFMYVGRISLEAIQYCSAGSRFRFFTSTPRTRAMSMRVRGGGAGGARCLAGDLVGDMALSNELKKPALSPPEGVSNESLVNE